MANNGQYQLITDINDIVPIVENYKRILENGNSNVFKKFSNFIYWYYFPSLNIFVPNLFLAYVEMADKDYPEHPLEDYGMDGGPAKDILKNLDCFTRVDNKENDLEKFVSHFNKNKRIETVIYILKDKYFDLFKHIPPFVLKDNNTNQQSIAVNKFKIINKANMIILPVLAFMIILPALSKYIGRIFQERKEDNWREKYVFSKLRETRDLPQNGSDEEFINKLDILMCLNIIIQNWDNIFKDKMKMHSYDLAHALRGIRNKESAHYTTEILSEYNYDDVDYALSTIIRFMRPIDSDVAEQISKIKRDFENT